MEKALVSILIGVVTANLMPKTDNGFKLGIVITIIATLSACFIIDLMLL